MIVRPIAQRALPRYFWCLNTLIFCLYISCAPATSSIQIDVLKSGLDFGKQHVCTDAKEELKSISDHPTGGVDTAEGISATLFAMLDALHVMQDEYFEVWQGIWPTGIDWTAAVLGTQVSAALSALSTSFDYLILPGSVRSGTEKAQENLVNRHFTQVVASYFGQDAFRLRNEAFDDMLWVVLGWLETINFIQLHSDTHYKEPQRPLYNNVGNHSSWHGKQFLPGFAHRARIFWDLGSKGWNTTLCGGGMIWSPWLAPYKNAITNELFVAASVSMYLYFPGDKIPSPFATSAGLPVGPRDPKYLAAAIEAYNWLSSSNMTNSQGLYVDGFSISGWEENPKNGTQKNTKCDSRNNMVYTYNQGVILSGQRGLWEATGARSYLDEGHELISNVINATGYDLKYDRPYKDGIEPHSPAKLSEWHGLGRRGILEDVCDAHGYCSQDAQTFKGIFFHHLTVFCKPLSPYLLQQGEILDVQEFQNLKLWHTENCYKYAGWIRRNAEAAMKTRTDGGKYGMWWGAPHDNGSSILNPQTSLPEQAIDYRNRGLPKDWTRQVRDSIGGPQQHPIMDPRGENSKPSSALRIEEQDPNDRGRGRTVETQAGGLAVLRALWEIVDSRNVRGER